MKITQINTDCFHVNNKILNFNEIKFSKDLLEELIPFKEKQSLAVISAQTMLESCKNKDHILGLIIERLNSLPYNNEFNISELPDNVKVFTNVGSDEEPVYTEMEIPKTLVLSFLQKNPNFSFESAFADNMYQEYLLTL